MPPKDYVCARQDPAMVRRVTVDGQPYLPHQTATAKGPRFDVAKAVLAVLLDIKEDNDQESMATSLHVEPVLGGLSNTLYRVSGLPVDHPHNLHHIAQVLVRIFGADGMIDRDVETSTFAALAQAGHVPPYYGRFANGRLEGWMEGMRPLQVPELSQPAVITAVAEKLAILHTQFIIPESLQEYYQTPNMWSQLKEWLHQALHNTYQTEHDQYRAQSLHLETIPNELSWLQESVIPHNAKVVYCHNDVLAANILFDDSTQQLQLIDFEYGGCNYASFDIANHWNEYASGPPFDTIPQYDWFPTVVQQTLFCRTYLETIVLHHKEKNHFNPTNKNTTTTTSNGNHSYNNTNNHNNNHSQNTAVTDQQVETLRREVQAFVLPNHLYWGLWAVNQAATEGCTNYDYMRYGIERFQQYHVCKQQWLNESTSSSSVKEHQDENV
jgi:thiamine kinase-like enzyme